MVVGQSFIVPAYSKASLYQQPIKQDSDEELEYAESSSGVIETSGKFFHFSSLFTSCINTSFILAI